MKIPEIFFVRLKIYFVSVHNMYIMMKPEVLFVRLTAEI